MRIDSDNVINTWLLEAKKSHKACKSSSLSDALPILRRLLASKVLVDISLPELHKTREIIQRKHLFLMFARESGYSSWAKFKQVITLSAQSGQVLLPSRLELKNAGYPTLWFASLIEAEEYALQHAGRVIVVGEQAAWLPK